MLTQEQIDHISAMTNARGVEFSQAGLGPDPYSFVSTALDGGQLSIDVKRQRTGSTFSDKTRAREVTDALINEVLTAIERRLQLKPAE